MLDLHINHIDLSGNWTWSGKRWTCRESFIEPFDHPALTASCEPLPEADGGGWTFTVRERRDTVNAISGEFCRVAATAQYVTITAGSWGTAPLFILERDQCLFGSWDLTRLPLRGSPLNEREAARLLTMRFRYTAETLFTGLLRLTERATIRSDFTGTPLVVYPEPAQHWAPRELAPEADVVAGYETVLDQVLAEYSFIPDMTAAQVSGGLDSANIALSLGSRPGGRTIVPGAVVVGGRRGELQAERRRLLIDRAGFAVPDEQVTASAHLPFCPEGARAGGERLSPYDEQYEEALTTLHRRFADRGARYVFTGVGGDEMVALNRTEITAQPVGSDRVFMPWLTAKTCQAAQHSDEGLAPTSAINEMSLIAMGYSAPSLLKAGLWPYHPFTHPRLIRFGEWLPEEWRRNKRLPRERLTRRGLPDRVTHPKVTESFAETMDLALVRYGVPLLRRLLSDGFRLVDEGLIDPDRLTDACDRIEAGTPWPRNRQREVFDALAVEHAIRTLTDDPALTLR
ncbi:asparagine synthase [Actinomadura atramentaria]|uniref:asparagine synthase n=1 Tax=Actinomadura atramentaria TaxID=1990 RepID=UPI0003A0CA33|nr:asparagine synthase [Actinomadura atramentaria]